MPKIKDPALLAQLNSGGVVLTDPYKERTATREDRALAVSERNSGIAAGGLAVSQANAARDAARQAAMLPADARKAEAEARKAELATEAAQKEQALAPRPETSRIQSALQTDNVIALINNARSQIGAGWSTGNVAGTRGFQGLPFVGQNSTNLSGSLEGIQGNVINDTLKQLKAASANGASGYGSLTESEGQRLAAAVASLKQTQDSESLLRNLATVERHYRNSLALLNNEDPRIPAVQEKYGIITPGASASPSSSAGGGTGSLSADYRVQDDPALAGANATVAKMIGRGATEPEVRSYLNRLQPGLGDETKNIDKAIEYHRQFPDKPIGTDLEKTTVSITGLSRTIGELGMSPWGSAVVGAADVASGGFLDNLSSNPEQARAVMAGLQQRNPTSYGVGQIGGGVANALLGEAALARLGVTGVAGSRVADALMGAEYGAGSADNPDDSRLSGALLGGALGVGGGMLGRGAARVAGRLGTGITDGARTLLDAAGVRMTPGQILGGVAQRTEDRIAGLPFVGDLIRSARRGGLQDVAQAAFDDQAAMAGAKAGGPIGPLGVENAFTNSTNAYRSALGGQVIPTDNQMVAEAIPALRLGLQNPSHGADFKNLLTTEVAPLAPNIRRSVTGEEYQDLDRALIGLEGAYNTRATGLNPEPIAAPVARAFGQLGDALEGNIQRNAPDVLSGYQDAKASYRMAKILQDATNRARNGSRSGTVDVFAPSQLADAAAANSSKFGGTQGTTKQPFYALTRAAQEVLPSSVPDSGTAGRLALPAIVGALAGGGNYAANGEATGGSSVGTGLAAAALAAAPYSPGARQVIQRALLAERPQAIQTLGQQLIERQRIAGLLASPAAAIEWAGQ